MSTPTGEHQEEQRNTDSDSDSESDSEIDAPSSEDEDEAEFRDDDEPEFRDDDKAVLEDFSWAMEQEDEKARSDSARDNVADFYKTITSDTYRRLAEKDAEKRIAATGWGRFDYPVDPENWKEEHLRELWADAPPELTKTGWDPHDVSRQEVGIINGMIEEGRDPPIAPFYLPYRKYYPVIPRRHPIVKDDKSAIENLDLIEEFLVWVSYIFEDGSTYEGTLWDDLAHGKGVFVGEGGLVRYEGEWLKNAMEGHGVVEVDIPSVEPIPGSKLEEQMRAEGHIVSRDFLLPEDKQWLEMAIEDEVILADEEFEIPFYERDEWLRHFLTKPEKGRYRYAGEWKHGKMHGCGVYEVNEQIIYGRFYFGELLDDPSGCDAEVSALHAGIADVAAAKARMFVNKPDGMVREARGPYNDPQHHYFYEEDDVWMAPGFINQFYEVPEFWKEYVEEVDREREMWLNSFYKAPLRIPMPSELEYWWTKGDTNPEFVLINKEPEPDPEDPSKLTHTEDPLILHTPTGQIINYVEDDEHGIRLFWQPLVKEGEEFNPDKVQFLPLGFDEFFGREEFEEVETKWGRLENACKQFFKRLEDWGKEKEKASEARIEQLKKEMELVDADLNLKEAIEDLDEELRIMQEEEERKGVEGEKDISVSELAEKRLEKTAPEVEEEDNEGDDDDGDDDDDDDDITPSSFGSIDGQNSANDDQKSSGESRFAASSLLFGSSNLVSLVPPKLQNSFSRWKEVTLKKPFSSLIPTFQLPPEKHSFCTVSFPRTGGKSLKLRCSNQTHRVHIPNSSSRKHSKPKAFIETERVGEDFNILSLHTPVII